MSKALISLIQLGCTCLLFVRCTIDLNLAELQYLADHLHTEECRRLVAALHFKSYQEPNALDRAESKVSKDIPCIRLLLHWNSADGEGKGESHEHVQHRLRQIGRSDLADWLGKAVFHELGREMEESLDDPLEQEILVQTQTTQTWNATEWVAFDTICWALIIGLGIFTLAVLGRVVCMLVVKRKRKRRNFGSKIYTDLETEDESGSEDKFDIRTRNDSALKALGLSRPTMSDV